MDIYEFAIIAGAACWTIGVSGGAFWAGWKYKELVFQRSRPHDKLLRRIVARCDQLLIVNHRLAPLRAMSRDLKHSVNVVTAASIVGHLAGSCVSSVACGADDSGIKDMAEYPITVCDRLANTFDAMGADMSEYWEIP